MFSITETTKRWAMIAFIIGNIIIFASILEQLLEWTINKLFYIILMLGKKNVKELKKIIFRVFTHKKTDRSFHYLSLVIIFIIAPSILIASDSFTHMVFTEHYDNIVGDMIIEGITPSIQKVLPSILPNDTKMLSMLQLTVEPNITYFFASPTQLKDFLQYTWSRAKGFSTDNATLLELLDSLEENPTNVLISQSLAEHFHISAKDTLSFYLPKDSQIIISPPNISKVDYTIISIVSKINYLSSKAKYWVFAPGSFINENNSDYYKISYQSNLFVFNSSMVNTIFLKLNNTDSVKIKDNLLTLFPSLSVKLLDDIDDINSYYPVPVSRFYQFIILQLVIGGILEINFFLLNLNHSFVEKRKPIAQLITKGISIFYIVFALFSYIISSFLVFIILGTFSTYFFSKGIINLFSNFTHLTYHQIYLGFTSKITITSLLVLFMLAFFIIGVYKIKKTSKELTQITGELT